MHLPVRCKTCSKQCFPETKKNSNDSTEHSDPQAFICTMDKSKPKISTTFLKKKMAAKKIKLMCRFFSV